MRRSCGVGRRLGFPAVTLAVMGLSASSLRAQTPDEFHWLGEINKASAVMLVERRVVPPEVGREIAAAVNGVLEAGNRPGGARPGDYLEFEQLLIGVAGPEVTRVHSGRSRQDIKGTIRRLFMREDLLLAFDRLLGKLCTSGCRHGVRSAHHDNRVGLCRGSG
jgi:argininosuccinate lyase